MSDLLFVYGTLRRGQAMHRQLAGRASFVAVGHITGRLYRVARYPGAVLSEDVQDKVFGELYRLENPAAVFRDLDRYEGAEFERRLVPIRLESGGSESAWVYLFTRPVGGLPHIASGHFIDLEL